MMALSALRHKRKSMGSSPNYPSTTPFTISAHSLSFLALTSPVLIHEAPSPYLSLQGTYARKLLAKLDMADCNSVKAPCDQRASYLHLHTETESPTDSVLYRSITSSIMHLAIWTRPNIAWIMNNLCQFNKDPSDLHMAAAKHLLRYIQGTLDYTFTYAPSEHNSLYSLFTDFEDFSFAPLHGYVDASGASDPDDRCLTSGLIFYYYGGGIVWAPGAPANSPTPSPSRAPWKENISP